MEDRYILVDIDDVIVKYGLTRLKNAVRDPLLNTTGDFRRAIVIDIGRDSKAFLDSLTGSKERLHYLDNAHILNYLILISDGVTCEIHGLDKGNLYMLNFVYESIPKDTIMRASVSLEDTEVIGALVKGNFSFPEVMEDGRVRFIRDPNEDVDPSLVYNNIKHAVNQEKSDRCYITINLTRDTLLYLYKLVREVDTETAGAFKIVGNRDVKGIIHHYLQIDYDTISRGGEEEVDILNDTYNFHTHPKGAYIRNGVAYAWPSKHDYTGFLKAVYHTNSVFHVVVTLEGLYIVSVSPEYTDINVLKDNEKYIMEAYNIPYDSFNSPENYIEYINKLGIFNVIYIEWTGVKPFVVHYPKIGGGCKI